MDIKESYRREFILGNIYGWTLSPDGYSVLLNKGSGNGVSEDDVIITDNRVLIGTVAETGENFSKILAVTDSRFKATVRVLGSNTIGIINGALKDGLRLDLIVQDEQIKEGDIIVTSGNDTLPDSLIVGRVSKVKLSGNQVFKDVLVEPAMKNTILDRVMILKK